MSNDNVLHINSLKEQGIHYYRNEVKIFCQTASSFINKKKIVVLDDLDLINELELTSLIVVTLVYPNKQRFAPTNALHVHEHNLNK